MKLSIEISEVEVESMSKVATQLVESILNGRTVLARVITESVDRTVAMACCRIDKIVEMQTVDAAARIEEAKVGLALIKSKEHGTVKIFNSEKKAKKGPKDATDDGDKDLANKVW